MFMFENERDRERKNTAIGISVLKYQVYLYDWISSLSTNTAQRGIDGREICLNEGNTIQHSFFAILLEDKMDLEYIHVFLC
jgi:hypothetical protein